MNFLKGMLTRHAGAVMSAEERRRAPRYRLKQITNLSVETGQSIFVVLDDISTGGARLRSDTPLRLSDNYVLKLKTFEKDLFFGFRIMWRKRDQTGTPLYGGEFVGPGSQSSPVFKEYLGGLAWKAAL